MLRIDAVDVKVQTDECRRATLPIAIYSAVTAGSKVGRRVALKVVLHLR